MKSRICLAAVLLFAGGAFARAELRLHTDLELQPRTGPSFSEDGPDAAAYGITAHYSLGSRTNAFEQQHLVATFSHFDDLFPFHTVSPAGHAWDFRRPPDLPQITYFHAGSRYSLEEYLAHLPITGLLIAKNDEILFEGYQYARTDHDRFTSQSMAKSIVGMLVGIALENHSLASVSDTASMYVPELRTADYGNATIRDLLHMSSGVACQAPEQDSGSIGLPGLASNCKQAAPAGTQFRYSAADSEVLGLVLSRAVKMPLALFLQQKIWQNIGTESKATWTIDASGRELPFCCFNATLRDYARFARLLASDGSWNGRQLIPSHWILDATTVKDSDAQLEPGKPIPFFGYGYQLWIFPGPRRMFALLGANGQRIFVDPVSKLILVQTAVMKEAMDRTKDKEMIGLWLSLVHHYGAS